MIIIDSALEAREKEGRPIRVGLVGAGFMAQGIALQLTRFVKGIRLVGVSNRDPLKAQAMLDTVGAPTPIAADTAAGVSKVLESGGTAFTADPFALCESDAIDVVVEVTGAIDHGAAVAMRAIDHGKHVVLMNAEVDGTVGPLLKRRADAAGVVLTNVDGDQPGVTMNLYRFVQGMGVEPVLCGNIKGLQDPYRNPTTQQAFAERWKQKPSMVTSFADGSKISYEQAIVANATGMTVAKRGMLNPPVPQGLDIRKITEHYPESLFEDGTRLVDYVVGAEPGPGVFVIGRHEDPLQRHYLALYKLGDGPYYVFFTPYHLCHFEVHNTIARAALFGDPALAPEKLMVDVVATAKTDLAAGAVLDGIGHYMTYGEAENASVSRDERLLPLGVAEGCTLVRDVRKDATLTYDDVTLPEGRVVDALRAEQAAVPGLIG